MYIKKAFYGRCFNFQSRKGTGVTLDIHHTVALPHLSVILWHTMTSLSWYACFATGLHQYLSNLAVCDCHFDYLYYFFLDIFSKDVLSVC